MSAKNKEYESGVSKVAQLSPQSSLLNHYHTLIQTYFDKGMYPGSPMLSANLVREMDNVHLMELHPAEFEKLNHVIFSQQHAAKVGGSCHVHQRDGFEGIKALTPPQPNRGAVLIDPPYERIQEYTDVSVTVKSVLQRWQQGQIVIWYPLLSARADKKSQACSAMIASLVELGIPCFQAELTVIENTEEAGMYGSGVLVLNPPWQLDVQLNDALQEVAPHLGDNTAFHLTWLVNDN